MAETDIEAQEGLVARVESKAEADSLVATLGDSAGFYKVGMELYAATGMDYVRSVIDRGKKVFLDMKYYDKLFGVFERMSTGATFEGIGVGLAIVRRIVQRHGGRVWAQSAPGQGASFYFALTAAQ